MYYKMQLNTLDIEKRFELRRKIEHIERMAIELKDDLSDNNDKSFKKDLDEIKTLINEIEF